MNRCHVPCCHKGVRSSAPLTGFRQLEHRLDRMSVVFHVSTLTGDETNDTLLKSSRIRVLDDRRIHIQLFECSSSRLPAQRLNCSPM
jgi:hypothetical protein